MECFKCGSDEHLFARCPERAPRRKRAPAAAPQPSAVAALPSARDYDEHLAVIDEYVAAWHRGEISAGEKRRAVSDENLRYYGEGCRKELLYEGGPGDGTRVRQDDDLPVIAARVAETEADAVAWAAGIRDVMGWSEDLKAQRLRELALAQAAESRASRLA